MTKIIIPPTWLTKFKQQIRYLYNDKDDLLSDILETCVLNIATQYLEIEEKDSDIWFTEENLQSDKRFMQAVFLLAATIFENPDIQLISTNGSSIDRDNIFRVLGSLTSFYKDYKPPAINPLKENNLKIEKLERELEELKNLLISKNENNSH